MNPTKQTHLNRPNGLRTYCGRRGHLDLAITETCFLALPYSLRCQDCERHLFASRARPVRRKPRPVTRPARPPDPPAPSSQCTQDTATQDQGHREETHRDNQDKPPWA